MVKISKTHHVTKSGQVKKNPSKSSKEDKMIAEVKTYLQKICKAMDEECLLYIYKEDGKVYFSTDGFLCTDVADPIRSEIPYLMRDAAQEFGLKSKKYNAYQYQEKVIAIFKKYGYGIEHYNSCTFYAYKED